MPTSSERPDLKAFLGEHTPFQAMSDEELTELATGSVVAEFPAGALVADYATRVPDDVWMVRTGQGRAAQQRRRHHHRQRRSRRHFRLHAAADRRRHGLRGLHDAPSALIRLPGTLVGQFAVATCGAGVPGVVGVERGPADRPTIAPATDSRPVAELVHGDVLLVSPDTSVRDAVVQMTEHHVSYALIRLPDGGLGIFTDRDLRTRVAAGLEVDVPIEKVSAPARSVTADLTADTLLMEMLECGLRHMPVLTSRGEVVGVLEDADLLAASARQGFMLRRSIGLAGNAAEVQKVGQRVTGLAGELFRNGTKSSATSAILSVVIDSLVRKALELALAEDDRTSTEGFAWLTLGSVARRRRCRHPMWTAHCRGRMSCRRRVRSCGQSVIGYTRFLTGCGLPSDSNGAIAWKPTFSRSQSDWSAAPGMARRSAAW